MPPYYMISSSSSKNNNNNSNANTSATSTATNNPYPDNNNQSKKKVNKSREKKLEKKWQFPPNNGGETAGFNNSAIDTFGDTPLSSAVRELIQNSLDAPKIKQDEPIKVQFNIHRFPKSEVPEITWISDTFESCLNVAKELKDLDHRLG